MDFITGDMITSVAVQIALVVALVAITRKIVGDRVKTIYYAIAWALLITLVSAFYAQFPINVQTAVIAVANSVLLVAGAFAGNELAVWGKGKLPAGEPTEREVAGASPVAPKKEFFSKWT